MIINIASLIILYHTVYCESNAPKLLEYIAVYLLLVKSLKRSLRRYIFLGSYFYAKYIVWHLSKIKSEFFHPEQQLIPPHNSTFYV
jgi:hypothetical protein